MKDLFGMAVGLAVLGLVASWMADSALPMAIIIAVIGASAAFADGSSRRGRRHR